MNERNEHIEGKNILFVITKSNWGGAQAYVFALAERLKELGVNVRVALGGTGIRGSQVGFLATRLTDAGIKVIPLPSMARDISLIQEVKSFIELYRIIRSENPDVLHLNSSKAGILGSIAGRIGWVPNIIFTAHGWPHREKRGLLMRSFIWLGSWVTVLFSHNVIAVSNCDVNTSPVLFSRQKIRMIHNGIDSFQLSSRKEAREHLSRNIPVLLKLPYWILLTAELNSNKGIDIALRAFAKIHIQMPHVALVIIGEGSERVRLEELVDSLGLCERVFPIGFISQSRKYLSAGNCFLLTSYKEGLPLVLLEAGLAQLPTIATSVGGIPEIVQNEISGLLVAPGEVTELAQALEKIISDEPYARKLGERLYQSVTERFSEEEMFRKTFALY